MKQAPAVPVKMTSRISAVTTVDEESDDDYNDISLHLRSFTAELDAITESLEQESQELFGRAARGQAPSKSRARRHPSHSSSAGKQLHSSQATPPAAMYDRTWNVAPATDTRRTRDGSLKKQYTPGGSDDGVPTPMKTPVPLMFSPMYASEPRFQQNVDQPASKQRWDSTSYTPYRADAAAKDARGQDRDDQPHHSLQDLPGAEAVETWKYLLNLMRDTVDRQDDRIQNLERENRELRAQVRSLEQDVSYLRHHASSPPAPPRYDPSPVYYAANPPNPLPPSCSPLMSKFTSPRTNLTSPYRAPSVSTPGTQFVAELTRLVQVDPVYHDPLSRIMDDHFIRTTQVREKYGW